MRNHIMSLKGLTLAALLTVLACATAGADDRGRGPSARHFLPVQRGLGFNASGRFSGRLAGDIMLNGVTFHLTDKTAVYELGIGPVELGTTVTDRFIFVSALHGGGYDTVYSVIIRPITDSTEGYREPTELDPAAPQ